MLVRNAAKCLICGDVIESKHTHDFVSCSCGALFVDGGHDYARMGGEALSLGKFEKLHIYTEEVEND